MNGHGRGCEFFRRVMALLFVSRNRCYTESITQGEKDVHESKKNKPARVMILSWESF